jgi:hypothetical protein
MEQNTDFLFSSKFRDLKHKILRMLSLVISSPSCSIQSLLYLPKEKPKAREDSMAGTGSANKEPKLGLIPALVYLLHGELELLTPETPYNDTG